MPMQYRTVCFALLLAVAGGCATTHDRRDPTGEVFPEVTGTRLDGRSVVLPEACSGEATLMLVGYKRLSQFDIDRWLLGLHDAGIDLPVYALPTIPGMWPRLFSKAIDDGMRRGIPEDDWAVVVTIYGGANKIVKFLGNQNPLPSRVVLLDAHGRVAYFHDRGYSVNALLGLSEVIDELRDETMFAPPPNTDD